MEDLNWINLKFRGLSWMKVILKAWNYFNANLKEWNLHFNLYIFIVATQMCYFPYYSCLTDLIKNHKRPGHGVDFLFSN